MNPLWDKITPCGDSLNFLGEALIVELNVTPTRLDLGSFLDVLDDFLSNSGMWIESDRESVVKLYEAMLRVFRDEGQRKDRQ